MDPDLEEDKTKSYQETGKNLKKLILKNSLTTFIVFSIFGVAFILMGIFIDFPREGLDLEVNWNTGNTVLVSIGGALILIGLVIYLVNLIRLKNVDLVALGEKETKRLEKENEVKEDNPNADIERQIKEIDPTANLEDRVTDDELDENGNIKEN